MKIKTYEDKHCPPDTRFTAEVSILPGSDYLKSIANSGCANMAISVFAPTKAMAVNQLKVGLRKLIGDLEELV